MSDAALEETPLPAPRDRSPTLLHRIEFWLATAMIACLRLVGVERASAIGGAVLGAIGPCFRRVSMRGEANLKMIYPDWDEARVRRTIRGVWNNLGRTTTEFAHLDAFDIEGKDARIEIDGRDIVDRLASSGRPMIFVSAHFANWEILSVALRRIGLAYGLVYRAANNPLIDAMIIRLRAKSGTRLQIPKGSRGARALVEALKSGRSLALLVDQKLTDGISAPFMGRAAPTGPTPARLAIKFGAPIVYASVERLPRARFRVTVRPPIFPPTTGDHDANILDLTSRINAEIERDIRARPEQWLWLHRRWGKRLPVPEVLHAGNET